MNTTGNHYPPLGETWIFDIGVAQVEQSYPTINTLHYRVITGPRTGSEDTVALDVKAIAQGIFLASWQEHDKITVVHVEDYNTGTFDSCVTMPDGTFRRFTSKMWRKS